MPADAPLSPGIASLDPDFYEAIVHTLVKQGWCLTPDFLPSPLIWALQREAQLGWESGAFQVAGVGRAQGLQVRPEIRGDRIGWLDPAAHTGPQAQYLAAIEALRLTVNRHLYLGLFEFEGHFALYPPGTHYGRHLDQFQEVDLRALTCVLYLNPDWREADGGQLRLYLEAGAPHPYVDISPRGGHLVTFLSARFEHEVFPAGRPRASLTGWLKRRPLSR